MSHKFYKPARSRLQRSELAVPGSSPEMFEKALNSKADYIFLDLEDAVSPMDKISARQNVIKALKEINLKNLNCIYTPEQISDAVDKNWGKFASAPDAMTVNKEECKSIVESTVNGLGKIGSKHIFNEEKFTVAYKKVDSTGAEKNVKAVVIGLVTALHGPDEKQSLQ